MPSYHSVIKPNARVALENLGMNNTNVDFSIRRVVGTFYRRKEVNMAKILMEMTKDNAMRTKSIIGC